MLTRNMIDELLEMASDNVLSLYLRVDPGYQPNQNTPRAWEIFVKNTMREIEQEVTGTVDFDAIRKHVDAFFEGYVPSGKSAVVFISEDGVLATYDLPISINNQSHFGEVDIVPLLWAIDEFERYLVVLADSEHARFSSAYLGQVDENDRMRLDFDEYDFGNRQFIHANQSGRAEGQQGSGGDQFDDMKREHVRRFHKDVADQIATLMREMDANRIVLGGNERAAHQVQELMHEQFQTQVAGMISISMQASESQIAEAMHDIALNYERSQELDLVNEVIGFAKADGRGVLTVDAVREALAMQQVELLILPYPMDDEQIARDLSLMALENGAEIELVHGSAAARLKRDATAAARLYYAVPEA